MTSFPMHARETEGLSFSGSGPSFTSCNTGMGSTASSLAHRSLSAPSRVVIPLSTILPTERLLESTAKMIGKPSAESIQESYTPRLYSVGLASAGDSSIGLSTLRFLFGSRKSRRWAVTLALLVGLPAMASGQSKWVRIGDTTRTPEMDVDASRIMGGKPHVHMVWTRVSYSPPKTINGLSVARELSQDVYDCAKGQTIAVRFALYDSGGNVVSSGDHYSDIGPPQWQQPFPDSVLELQIRGVCRYFNEAGY